jgi:hypothetical protein
MIGCCKRRHRVAAAAERATEHGLGFPACNFIFGTADAVLKLTNHSGDVTMSLDVGDVLIMQSTAE